MHKTNDFMLKADRDLLAARLEKRWLKWEKARRHGAAYYILVRCILPILVINCLWAAVFRFYLGGFGGVRFLSLLVSVSVVSAVFGVWEWHWNEKRYRRR